MFWEARATQDARPSMAITPTRARHLGFEFAVEAPVMTFNELIKNILVQDLLNRGAIKSAVQLTNAEFGSELNQNQTCARTDEGESGLLVSSKPKLTLVTITGANNE